MYKYEACVRMEDRERHKEIERNGVKVYVKGREPRGQQL